MTETMPEPHRQSDSVAAPTGDGAVPQGSVPISTLVDATALGVFHNAPRAELVTVAVRAVDTESADSPVFLLDGGAGLARARRAAGCLVLPEPGDLVLAACTAGREPLIIAVLVRGSAGAATLSVPDASEIELAARTSLTVRAPTLEVEAETGRFAIKESHLVGRTVRLVVDTAETLYSTLQTFAEKLIVKAGHALRIVDEVDSTVATTVLVQAKQTYSLQATQVVTTATEDVRLDGERISMG